MGAAGKFVIAWPTVTVVVPMVVKYNVSVMGGPETVVLSWTSVTTVVAVSYTHLTLPTKRIV